jgi:hypothetical protein
VKNFLSLVAGVILAGLLGYWTYLTYFQAESWIIKDVSFEIQDSAGAQKIQPPVRQKQEKIIAGCYVWGPFPEKSTSRIVGKIKKAGLSEKVGMRDRFLPEMYIAYLGPFDNKEAALAFQKQFRKQGYKNARAILQGGLSFGVEIAAFPTSQEVQKFLTGPNTPNVKGVRLTNRLGEPSGKVDFIFQNISEEEHEKLSELWRGASGSELRSCSF